MTGLPNVTGDAERPETVDQWFNTAAFTPVASGFFGNELRNRLTGPGFQNVDLTSSGRSASAARRRDAALGHLQRVQHGQLRAAEPQHQRRGDLRHHLEPVERCAHHADRGAVHVLTRLSYVG